MRMGFLLVATMATTACATLSEESAQSRNEGSTKPVNLSDFREKCVSFESLNFGAITARSLSGHVWVGIAKDNAKPFGEVQVAARSTASGTLVYANSASDGRYELKLTPGEEYDVWTCQDGFDELRFRFIIDPSSTATSVDLYVGLSEAPGWRDVVLKAKQ